MIVGQFVLVLKQILNISNNLLSKHYNKALFIKRKNQANNPPLI